MLSIEDHTHPDSPTLLGAYSSAPLYVEARKKCKKHRGQSSNGQKFHSTLLRRISMTSVSSPLHKNSNNHPQQPQFDVLASRSMNLTSMIDINQVPVSLSAQRIPASQPALSSEPALRKQQFFSPTISTSQQDIAAKPMSPYILPQPCFIQPISLGGSQTSIQAASPLSFIDLSRINRTNSISTTTSIPSLENFSSAISPGLFPMQGDLSKLTFQPLKHSSNFQMPPLIHDKQFSMQSMLSVEQILLMLQMQNSSKPVETSMLFTSLQGQQQINNLGQMFYRAN